MSSTQPSSRDDTRGDAKPSTCHQQRSQTSTGRATCGSHKSRASRDHEVVTVPTDLPKTQLSSGRRRSSPEKARHDDQSGRRRSPEKGRRDDQSGRRRSPEKTCHNAWGLTPMPHHKSARKEGKFQQDAAAVSPTASPSHAEAPTTLERGRTKDKDKKRKDKKNKRPPAGSYR